MQTEAYEPTLVLRPLVQYLLFCLKEILHFYMIYKICEYLLIPMFAPSFVSFLPMSVFLARSFVKPTPIASRVR